MEQVYLARCLSYNQTEVDRAVDKIFAGLPLTEKLVKPGQTVFLKANLLMRKKPEEAVTTHPAVVQAVAKKFVVRGCRVIIGDSPGGPFTPLLLKGIYRASGMEEAARLSGAELNYNVECVNVPNPEGYLVKSLTFSQAIWDADLIVNLAKLKTHGMMVFTGAVKNLFGIIPGLLKAEYHLKMPNERDFAHLLVDICEKVKPCLSIIDGIMGMEGDGPSAGNPRKLDILIAGQSPYLVDAAGCFHVGLSLEKVPVMRAAKERGLFKEKIDMQILGDFVSWPHVSDFRIPMRREINFYRNKVPKFMERRLDKLLTPRPVFRHELCSGCEVCKRQCPPAVISMINGKPAVDVNKCIRCFCCQELCPSQAIEIRRPWLTEKIFQR